MLAAFMTGSSRPFAGESGFAAAQYEASSSQQNIQNMEKNVPTDVVVGNKLS
jgi:hypothetical protein